MVEGLEEFIRRHNINTRDGKLVLYKAVSKEWGSLWVRMEAQKHEDGPNNGHGAVGAYQPGAKVRAKVWNDNRYADCGAGLHVGTLPCAVDFLDRSTFFSYGDGRRRLIEVLVDPEDVVAVPFWSRKIRCKRLVVVGEVTPKGNPRKTRREG